MLNFPKNKTRIEWLIENEHNLSYDFWEEFSTSPEIIITLPEARLFRSQIHWDQYFRKHVNQIFPNEIFLEVASKYFTKETYNILGFLYTIPEEFLNNKFSKFIQVIGSVLEESPLSEEFLLEHVNMLFAYLGKERLKKILEGSKANNLKDPRLQNLRLLLETI